MSVPKIYHPFRKAMVKQIVYSTIFGTALAECFWHFYAVPKVERRNEVMKMIEADRQLRKESIAEAISELNLPAQGSFEDLYIPS